MENRERLLNAEEAAQRFEPVLAAGGEVTLAVTGNSMRPFLCQGRDRVHLKAPARPPRRGDILFFRRSTGEWVLHRVLHRTAEGYAVSGDAQLWVETVNREQVVAVVTAVEREGRRLSVGDPRLRVESALRMAARPVYRVRNGVRRFLANRCAKE